MYIFAKRSSWILHKVSAAFQNYVKFMFQSTNVSEKMLSHPVNLLLLYRHWSKSAGVWRKRQGDQDLPVLREMVQLAPSIQDTEGMSP
jgi:hypothetical protein